MPKHYNVDIRTGIGVTVHPPKVTAHNRLPPDHPMQALVGRVANDWSHVEHILDVIIWRLAKLDDHTGACLTGQMLGSFARLIAIYALAVRRNLSQEILDDITELTKKCKDPQVRRNRILHDAWYLEGGANVEQFKAMAKDEYLFGFHPIDDGYLTKTLEKIDRRHKQASDLLAKIRDAL